MRILMASRGVLPIGRWAGGAELAAFELAKHLAMQQVEVTLIADVDHLMHDNIPSGLHLRDLGRRGQASAQLVLLVPFAFPRWLGQHLVGNIRAARRTIVSLSERASEFDAVHAHGALATIMIGRAVRRSGMQIPLIYTEHDSTPWTCPPRSVVEHYVRRAVYRFVNLRACRSANFVVTSYDALAAELSERTGLPRERFVIAPNGTDIEHFVSAAIAPCAQQGSGSQSYCLFVGSLIERKAPDALLRAFATADTDLDLVLIGAGPMSGQLQRLTRSLKLASRVTFKGAQRHDIVQACYQEAAFVVLPSVSETAPLVLIEALSTGTPVIATNLKGIASVVRDGENGLLVPPGDIGALAGAITRLANDPELYTRLAANAAPSVRGLFSWPVIARQHHLVYGRKFDALGTDDGLATLHGVLPGEMVQLDVGSDSPLHLGAAPVALGEEDVRA